MPSLRKEPDFFSSVNACLYGSQDRRDRVLFEFHAFSIIVTVSLCFLLLGSEKLRRIYKPLFIVVNIALLLQVLSDVLFFSSYPYSETQGNCSEVFVGKLNILLIMFGESHQLYFIANVLGLSRFRFSGGSNYSISLESFLQLSTVLAGVSIFISVFVKGIFMINHLLWALFIVILQLYFIHHARFGPRTDAVIDANIDAVRIFEMISWLQIIPTCIALVDRILELNGLNYYGSLDGVMLILESLGVYLFYIKILVLQEKASTVSVEVFDEK
jgi:hypothetical protein